MCFRISILIKNEQSCNNNVSGDEARDTNISGEINKEGEQGSISGSAAKTFCNISIEKTEVCV